MNKNSTLEEIYRRVRESLKDENLPSILVGGLPLPIIKKEK